MTRREVCSSETGVKMCDTMSPPQLAALPTVIATRLAPWAFLGKLMEVGSHLPQKKASQKTAEQTHFAQPHTEN